MAFASRAAAESNAPEWSTSVSGAFYILSDQANFLQPTVRSDRGRLHLEARYNYEDRRSVSFFAGANLEAGDQVALSVTPMIGGLVGGTDGIVPAIELDLGWRKLEAYGEAEYVFGFGGDAADYFYMWSELSVWPTEWLRAGAVSQRTRVHAMERELQPGILVGARHSRVEGAVYVFSPGGEDAYAVVSLAVEF